MQVGAAIRCVCVSAPLFCQWGTAQRCHSFAWRPACPHPPTCLLLLLLQGISHARLPIGGFIQLASSPVMTTNHVVDIMLRWLELR
jgi:hypothetical protein